jgi:hypothetical protein
MTNADQPQPLDRYVSFIALDCDHKAERLVATLREALDQGETTDPFWTYFRAKLDGERGPAHDALYHVHCHINDLRDLLARAERPDLNELLEALEHDCC